MSPWIVDRDHLDLLLTAAIDWDVITPDQADETGRMLWKENLTSVAHCYPHDRDGSRPGPDDFRDRDVDTYRYQPYPGRIDPEVIHTATASLWYQSSEHPGWDHSTAAQWLNRLHRLATDRIPAYLAEYGPIDTQQQIPGEDNRYAHNDLIGWWQVHPADGWAIADRDALHRVAALRTGATP